MPASKLFCVSAVLYFSLCGPMFAGAQGQQQPRINKPATADAETNRPPAAAVAPKVIPDASRDLSISPGGRRMDYTAIAGTLTVAADDGHDAQIALDGQWLPEANVKGEKPEEDPATARIFYAAYFAKGAVAAASRPVTFLYNGGPGSASMWLHMGSFGPRRVVVPDTQHQAAAPYTVMENAYTLLDVSDVVFIDAPGTGFSRIFGKDKEKSFWGTDQDAHAFDRFIRRFLTKYDRWNSPKYLLGESYGTTRSAALSAALQDVDLNGIILLSQILSFDNSPDGPRWNPGVDYPYELALPTYAATAFFHKRVPQQPGALEPFLRDVEHFAQTDYAQALQQGDLLPDDQRQTIAAKLYGYTGVPAAYWLKSDLRLSGGQFSKTLQDDAGITVGRLDTRFSGPDVRRTSEEADYDPQSVAISAGYTAAVNHYLREEMHFGKDMTYLPGAYNAPGFVWDLRHQPPGGPPAQENTSVNVMTDLAKSMKANPHLHVMLAGGYYDLATPYFAAEYEMHHLPIPKSLAGNISYHFYPSGHMVYVNEDVLRQFHDDVAGFIRSTAGGR